MRQLRVALVQVEARDDVDDNLERAAALAGRAAEAGARLVILPEYVQYRGSDDGYRASAAPVPGPTTQPFQDVAGRHGCWILAGSVAETSGDPSRPFNTSPLIDPSGRIVARYRKLHLFDVDVDHGPADTESARVSSGDRAVVADVEGFAGISKSSGVRAKYAAGPPRPVTENLICRTEVMIGSH